MYFAQYTFYCLFYVNIISCQPCHFLWNVWEILHQNFGCFLAVDTTPPTVIGCPSGITEILSLGMGSSLSVTWDPEPFGNDVSPPVTTNASHSPGQLFVIGTTTVTYTFQDRFENVAICSFDVNVIEGKVLSTFTIIMSLQNALSLKTALQKHKVYKNSVI